jgi:cob(I)alamin adenosyltransferase
MDKDEGSTRQRFTQIYTGNGKGKTTAAIGQAVRAAGCGLKSCLIMFMKEYPYSELAGLQALSEWITVGQYGGDEFVYRKEPPGEQDLAIARQALARAKQALQSGDFDIVILDEVCVAVYFGLLAAEQVAQLIRQRPEQVELILTGRYCPEELYELADLVTEMKEVKHYYRQGVLARKGFDS